MEFTILVAIICVAFGYATVLCAKLSERICKLENYVNQLPCLSEPVEDEEGEKDAPKTEK